MRLGCIPRCHGVGVGAMCSKSCRSSYNDWAIWICIVLASRLLKYKTRLKDFELIDEMFEGE